MTEQEMQDLILSKEAAIMATQFVQIGDFAINLSHVSLIDFHPSYIRIYHPNMDQSADTGARAYIELKNPEAVAAFKEWWETQLHFRIYKII